MTLTDLANSIEAFSDALPTVISTKAVQVAETIVDDLAAVTPADTGAALSNWQVTLDSPAESPVEPYTPSPRGRMVNGQWTHTVAPDITRAANAPATIDAAKIHLQSRIPGQLIFITNVLPYVEILDQGSSDQAPAGFVDRAVILARETVDKTGI